MTGERKNHAARKPFFIDLDGIGVNFPRALPRRAVIWSYKPAEAVSEYLVSKLGTRDGVISAGEIGRNYGSLDRYASEIPQSVPDDGKPLSERERKITLEVGLIGLLVEKGLKLEHAEQIASSLIQ